MGLQILQQACGINTVMYYTPLILEAAGFRDRQAILLMSLLPAGVNAAGTVVGMACIDRFGRRRLLLTSLAGVALTLGALGAAFRLAERSSPPVRPGGSTCPGLPAPPDCTACIRHGCAFCGDDGGGGGGGGGAPGSCLPLGAGGAAAETCAAAAGLALSVTSCPSAYTVAILMALMAYLAAFSPGLGPVPWAVNAEIYPTSVRGLATGARLLPAAREACAGASYSSY